MSQLRGIARFKFHEGKVEEFKRLSQQCMEIVRAGEPGTLQYDVYFNDDESECIVYEEYADSQALIDHLAHVGELMAPVMDTATVTGELLGVPSDGLRTMMSGGEQPRLFEPYLSMHGIGASGGSKS